MLLDIQTNRQTRNYSRVDMVRRILWMLGQWLFRLSPRPCFGWRRFVLRCFGARIAPHVHIYNSAIIYYPWNLQVDEWSSIGEWTLFYNLGPVTLGRRVTVSVGARLCAGTHDYTRPDMPLLKPAITVNDDAWICAEAFIGPGVEIGKGAVIGARAVVMRAVEPWTVVTGNPARTMKRRELRV